MSKAKPSSMPAKKYTLQIIGETLQVLVGRFDGLEGRFDGLEKKVGGLNRKVTGIDKKLTQLWSKVYDMDDYLTNSVATKDQLAQMERRINKRFDLQTKQIERVEQELVFGNERFERIEKHVGLAPAERTTVANASPNA
jgi:hypothetical protein